MKILIILKLKMWLYVKVEGQNKVRLGETTSMKVLVVNKWEEPVDVLLSIPASDDYSFMEIDRDDGARANAVDGEQQVCSYSLRYERRNPPNFIYI